MLIRNFILFISVFVAFAAMLPVHAHSENLKYASIVVDAETGKVLRARNANKLLYPASLTKIMTLYMAFDALSKGEIRLNDRVVMSKHAAGMEPSKINIPVGSSIKVEDAIYVLVTKSANDVAAALAEHIGGSEWAFANKMTAKARALGMKDTTFKNASGLPDLDQKTTARDMAILARALIYNHPQYYHYFSTKNFKYRGASYNNHNKLLNSYKGMDGIKTGYIHASGFNLVASAVRDNRRIVGVVFGGRSTATRNSHMVEILDEGFELSRDLPPTRLATNIMPSSRVPTPNNKPDITQVVLASMRSSTTPPTPTPNPVQVANAAKINIDEVLGQGDIDPNASDRLQTGLMAIAAHTGRSAGINGVGQYGGQQRQALVAPQVNKPQALPTPQQPAQQQVSAPSSGSSEWAIQIGAYSSEKISQQAVQVASQTLPPEIRSIARAISLPLTTGSRTIYRARMEGFDEATAQKACAYLRNCMVIAP